MSEDFKKELDIEIKRAKNNWSNDFIEQKLNEVAIREIFAIKHEINLARDENGMVIPGTGRVITNEEKKMIFDYIIENNYPITRKIYNLILKGYINGEINLVKEENKSMRV